MQIERESLHISCPYRTHLRHAGRIELEHLIPLDLVVIHSHQDPGPRFSSHSSSSLFRVRVIFSGSVLARREGTAELETLSCYLPRLTEPDMTDYISCVCRKQRFRALPPVKHRRAGLHDLGSPSFGAFSRISECNHQLTRTPRSLKSTNKQ